MQANQRGVAPILLLVGLGVVLLSLGLLAFNQYGFKKETTSPVASPTASAVPTLTIVPTPTATPTPKPTVFKTLAPTQKPTNTPTGAPVSDTRAEPASINVTKKKS